MHRVLRAAVAFCVAPALALSTSVAPEHLHKADADHHSHAVVHRHLESHHHGTNHPDTTNIFDHHTSNEDQDDDNVVWLDGMGVEPATHSFAVAHAIVITVFETLPAPAKWIDASVLDAAPPHGPPRASISLRGPPLPARLT